MRLFRHQHGWTNLDLMTDALNGKIGEGSPCIRIYFAAVDPDSGLSCTLISDPEDLKRLTALLDDQTIG